MTKANLDEIRNKALPIPKEAGVTRSSLFGSFVRGENREDSDIDILVDFPRERDLRTYVAKRILCNE